MKTETRFTDAAELTNVSYTADGYLVAWVRCARAGCQQYFADEIGLAGEEPVNVYRPESAVFARDSMASYAGKPVTLDHPGQQVNADNWRSFAVGEIGDEVVRDGGFVRVGIMVRDASAINAIKGGTQQISMGYTTPIEHVDGVAPDGTPYRAVQTGPIKINHLALVDRARGGDKLRIGDGAISWGTAPIPTSLADTKGSVMTDKLRTVLVDGLSVETTDSGAQAIEKLTKTIADRDTALVTKDADIAALRKQIETKDGELAATKKALADAVSPKALAKAVAARAAVLDAAKKAGLKEEETEEMDDSAIRRAVVTNHLGDAAKEMSDAAIEGAFTAIVKTAKPVGDAALGAGLRTADASASWASFLPKKGAN